DAGGNLQREILRITAAQVPGENHYPLGVDRLTEIDLTLDVDDARATRVDGGGNPRRNAERRITNFQHCESTAFADGRALGIHEHDARTHVVENTRRDASATARLGAQGPLEVAGIGSRITRKMANEIGSAEQLEQTADTRRQAPLMLGQTRTVGRQARYSRRGERREPFFRGTRLD